MLQKTITLTICLLLAAALQANALQKNQSTDMEVNQKRSLAYAEENFRCFQSLQCLKRENPFPNSNLGSLNLNNNRVEQYVVEGSSENGTMHAIYNSQGDLIKATVIQRDVALPKAVADVLVSGEYRNWTMIGNEIEVRNFDKDQIRYKVILQKDTQIKIEYLNRHGEFLNRIL
jgi:hypothetical protein